MYCPDYRVQTENVCSREVRKLSAYGNTYISSFINTLPHSMNVSPYPLTSDSYVEQFLLATITALS
jgi:hypothetical protein